MKVTTCAKCGSGNVATITNRAEARAVMLGKTVLGLVHPTSYICTDCGYIEEYLEEKDLEKLRKRYR